MGQLRETLARAIARARGDLVDPAALAPVLERLCAEGAISRELAGSLRAKLPVHLGSSRYILSHLGAHLGIVGALAFDLVPLPLGTVARVSWVAVNRFIEQLRGQPSRARVHSVGVLLVAAIPFFGYGAYLVALRKQSTELAFVLANYTWLVRTGRTYEQFVADTSPPIRRFARWLVPHPSRA